MTGPRRPARPGDVIHGNLAAIVGRPWSESIFWVVVLGAAAVDIATFYQVLVVVLNAPEWLVWAAVIGFVAVVLTLAHQAGVYLRHAADPRPVTAATILAWVFGGGWLVLGLVAFGVRLVITQPLNSDASSFSGDGTTPQSFGAADTGSQHVTAVLFLALYIATGIVTALVGGYARSDPNAKMFRRAVSRRSTAIRRHAATKRRFDRVVQLAAALDAARARSDDARTTAHTESTAAAERLRREIRLRMAATPSPGSTSNPDNEEPTP